MRRLAVISAAVATVGLGSAVAVAQPWRGGATSDHPAATAPASAYVPAKPTAAQLAYRAQYFAAIKRGDQGVIDCGCTAGTRSKDRAAARTEARRAAAARSAEPGR